MRNFRIMAIALAGVFAGRLNAQSGAEAPQWETLMRAPVPGDSVPQISALTIPVAPAPPTPRQPGPGHTHAGPVFAYILQGDIENQVEPDPPAIYKPGEFFSEIPGHVHRFLRNRSTTEPAKILIFQEGATGTPAPVIKILLQEPLRSTANQEVSLLRLTLAPAGHSEVRTPSNPGILYVLEGKIQTTAAADQPKLYAAGDVFVVPAGQQAFALQNANDREPARLLVYQVSGNNEVTSAQ